MKILVKEWATLNLLCCTYSLFSVPVLDWILHISPTCHFHPQLAEHNELYLLDNFTRKKRKEKGTSHVPREEIKTYAKKVTSKINGSVLCPSSLHFLLNFHQIIQKQARKDFLRPYVTLLVIGPGYFSDHYTKCSELVSSLYVFSMHFSIRAQVKQFST